MRFEVGMEVGIQDGIRAREDRRHKGGRVSIRGTQDSGLGAGLRQGPLGMTYDQVLHY